MSPRAESRLSLYTNDAELRRRLAAVFVADSGFSLLSEASRATDADIVLVDSDAFAESRHRIPSRPTIILMRPGAGSLGLQGLRVAGSVPLGDAESFVGALLDLLREIDAPMESYEEAADDLGAGLVAEAQVVYESDASYGEGSEGLFSVAFDAVPYFLALLDEDGFPIAVNRAGRESAREYSNKPFWQWSEWAAGREALEAAFSQTRSGKPTHEQVGRHEIRFLPLPAAGYGQSGILACVTTTDKVGTTSDWVLDSLRTVRFTAIPEGDFRPEWISGNAAELLGIDPGSADTRATFWVDRFSPEDYARVRSAVRNIFHVREAKLALRYLHPAGETLWVAVELHLQDDAGKARIDGILTDVTAHRRLEEIVAAASRFEAGATVATGVVNSLNNTMLSIIGHADMLRDDLLLRPDHATLLEQVTASAQRAGELARRILTYTRGNRSAAAEADPGEILEAIVAARGDIMPPEVTLIADVASDLPMLSGDPLALAQMVLNLLRHAFDVTPKGGEVTLSARVQEVPPADPGTPTLVPAGRHVVITVEDQGERHGSQSAEQLFSSYFAGGIVGRCTGLGAVYAIVQSFRGTIAVEPGESQGKRILVFL